MEDVVLDEEEKELIISKEDLKKYFDNEKILDKDIIREYYEKYDNFFDNRHARNNI